VLVHGRVVATGPPDEIATELTTLYLGGAA
jgi:hypothetical protein